MNNYKEELKQLQEYMFIYIQLLENKFHYLPTFTYFKETYNNPEYSLVHGSNRETDFWNIRNGKFINYWCGVKYYPPKQYFTLTKEDI